MSAVRSVNGQVRLDHEFFEHETRPHLGAVLLGSSLLKPEQLDVALAQQQQEHKRLGEILIERGWLFPQDIARALAMQEGLDYVDIQYTSVDAPAAKMLDPEIGRRHCAIPVRFLAERRFGGDPRGPSRPVSCSRSPSRRMSERRGTRSSAAAAVVEEVEDVR